jgi:hypothetical protein
MNMKSSSSVAVAALVGMMAAIPAVADIITIEPDFYADGTSLMHVAPGATLFNYRWVAGDVAPVITPALAVPWSWLASSPAPTGRLVFGHVTPGPADHWAGVQNAKGCVSGGLCGGRFYVFVAYFHTLTSFAEIRTTMAPWAIDGAELWAFNANGKPLAACNLAGVTASVRRTGVMPNPTYGSRIDPPPVPLVECGKVLARQQCKPTGLPGECSYIVSAQIRRTSRDVAFVMWGAYHSDDSTAPVDRLRYDF